MVLTITSLARACLRADSGILLGAQEIAKGAGVNPVGSRFYRFVVEGWYVWCFVGRIVGLEANIVGVAIVHNCDF